MISGLLLDYGGVMASFEKNIATDLLQPKDEFSTMSLENRTQPADSRMIEIVRRFRNGGGHVGILSNASIEIATLSRQNGTFDPFDFAVVSSEVGLRKPDPEIYRVALEHFNPRLNPQEILYVDDTPRHVTAASALGFNALLTKLPECPEVITDWLAAHGG